MNTPPGNDRNVQPNRAQRIPPPPGLNSARFPGLYGRSRFFLRSSFAAGVGVLLFGFRANFADIYWSFGTIFELLALLLMMLALVVHISDIRFPWRVGMVALLYLLAVKSKEMAITFPAVLLLSDLCLRRERLAKHVAVLYAVLGVFGLAFGYSKLATMGSTARSDPYFMDLSESW